MFDPFAIEYPYGVNQFIDNLQAYNSNQGTDEMLDLIREIQQSGNYYWQGIPLPVGSATTVSARATVTGSIQVPQGTWVTSITYYSSQEEGFKLKIFDKGSKASIFYGDYACIRNIASSMLTSDPTLPIPSDAGSNSDIPLGPGYLMEPFIINDPGVLGWEVVNQSASSNVIQVMLACAVPINKASIGLRTVDKG